MFAVESAHTYLPGCTGTHPHPSAQTEGEAIVRARQGRSSLGLTDCTGAPAPAAREAWCRRCAGRARRRAGDMRPRGDGLSRFTRTGDHTAATRMERRGEWGPGRAVPAGRRPPPRTPAREGPRGPGPRARRAGTGREQAGARCLEGRESRPGDRPMGVRPAAAKGPGGTRSDDREPRDAGRGAGVGRCNPPGRQVRRLARFVGGSTGAPPGQWSR